MDKLSQLKNLTQQKVSVEAIATSDAIYAERSQLEFTADHVQQVEPESKPLAGSFKISGFGVPMVYRGDKVKVTAKLFPMRGSNQARMAYAQIARIGEDTSSVNNLTRHFAAGMQNTLPEPQASFALGLLIGQRSTLPQNITDYLIAVGLVHIVAVSGYNLTIIVRAIGRMKLGSKYQKLVVSLALITIFLLITGFHASIVRAAIVSGLGLIAWYYGRQIRPILLISFTAALTGFINPFYVWSDLGWYLSFLAFFGVLVIAPLIAKRLFKKVPTMLTMVLLETLAAELMTLPLILMIFGRFSLISLLANLLIVPLVPVAMLLSAIAGVAGMLFTSVAGWLAWPAVILLTYMLDLVRILASVPSVLVHKTISLGVMLGSYVALLVFVLGLHKHSSTKNGIITDKKPV